jgi:peptidoglycan/LPS O-acetylase OafA/YrhL
MAMAASGEIAPRAAARATESVRAEVGHLAPMDGMRGIAVLWVVFFHIIVLRGKLDDPWVAIFASIRPIAALFGAGYLGVDLFFLISGFLLTLPWFVHARKGLPAPSAREFYARRFWRIAPAYYAQLVLLFLLVVPLLRGATYWRSDLYVYIYNAIAHATFLHNTTPLSSGSMGVNGALWTLGVEAQYYLLVPLLAPIFVRAPRAALAVALCLAALWRMQTHYGLDGIVAVEMALGRPWSWPESVVRYLLLHQLPSYLGHFALGIVLGRAWLAWREREHRAIERAALDAAVVFSLGVLYWVIAIDGAILGEHTWILPTLALAALLFRAATSASPLARNLLGRGALAFAGRVSYSAYLYHLPLLILWNLYGAFIPAWTSLPLYLATLFAIAWLSWRFIEQPFIHGKVVSGTTFR